MKMSHGSQCEGGQRHKHFTLQIVQQFTVQQRIRLMDQTYAYSKKIPFFTVRIAMPICKSTNVYNQFIATRMRWEMPLYLSESAEQHEGGLDEVPQL
jgi:hypothetical protein